MINTKQTPTKTPHFSSPVYKNGEEEIDYSYSLLIVIFKIPIHVLKVLANSFASYLCKPSVRLYRLKKPTPEWLIFGEIMQIELPTDNAFIE